MTSSMRPVKKVALAGASGNLGPAILEQLLKSFEVTVLTRQSSTHTFPQSVRVKKVDYSSFDSLVSALNDQDALVSTLATLAFDRQLLLIDAAVTAGIRRFIPSEFGSDTSDPKATALPVFKNKAMAHKVLQDKAALGVGFTYTIIYTGPFLDWGLRRGFMNIKEKRARLYNGGSVVYSTTTLPTIGKAVCGVLNHLDETKNRVVKVQDTATTQNKLLQMAMKAAGPDGWKVEDVSTSDLLEEAWKEFKEGKAELSTMWKFIPAVTWAEGFEGRFQRTDNELLGIKDMSDAELQMVVDQVAE